VTLLELRAQIRVLRGQTPFLQRLLQHVHQLVELERLGHEIRRAAFDGVHGVLHGAVAGDDDADDARVALERGFDDAGPLDARHLEVGDHHVEGKTLHELERLFAAVGLDDLEPPLRQPLGHERTEGGFVIDEQDVCCWHSKGHR
jgi:hypothetical protein